MELTIILSTLAAAVAVCVIFKMCFGGEQEQKVSFTCFYREDVSFRWHSGFDSMSTGVWKSGGPSEKW